MASVYQRGNVWWGRWRAAGRTVRHALSTATTRDEALKAAREREATAKLSDTEAKRLGSWTVGRVLTEWLAIQELKHSDKPGTVRAYRGCLTALPPRWQGMRADNFPLRELLAFQREQLDVGIENVTVNARVARFTSALRWAAGNPETGVRVAPEARRKNGGNTPGAPLFDTLGVSKGNAAPVGLDEEQQAELLARVEETQLEAPVCLALWAGLRRAELCRLRWDVDVNLVRGQITVQQRKASGDGEGWGARERGSEWSPKSKRPRVIDLPRESLAWLKAYRARQKLDGWPALRGDPVCLYNGGRSWTPDTLNRHVGLLFAELGISCEERHTLHMLRHTFAMSFLEAGGNLESLRAILGHAKLETTAIYLRATDKGKARDMAKMKPLPRRRSA